jgi:hypothetical protein
MDEMKWIKGLDANEPAGEPVDVASWVVRDLRAMRAPEERVLGIAAWIGTAAAVLAIVAGVQAWSALQDPLGNLVSSFTMVLQ